jgi:hypothetical protein
MPKTKISDYSSTANDNSDINSINIAEGCAPSNINDAIREMMAQLKNYQAGLSGDSVSAVGSVIVKGTSTTGADIQLYEDTDNGTNYVAFKAPSTIASNVTWTLPSADGTSSQVLQTNGSGTLSWATAASGDVTLAGNNALTGANTFYNATGQTFAPASTNDGIIVQGRAGGSSSYRVTFTTTTLSGSRTITLPDANINFATGLGVANGGTGLSTTTAYGLIAAGTTSTGNFQQVSGTGTSGQVLTSNGAGALPTWQTASSGGTSVGTVRAIAINCIFP